MNTYLKKTDLESSIRDNRLEQILDNEDGNELDVFALAAMEAESIVEDYLTRFEIVEELAKVGDDRKRSIIFHLKNICLYILYERIEDDNVPERIIKNYNDSIDFLQKVAKGKLTIGLSIKKIDTNGDGEGDTYVTKFRWGGEKRRRN